MKELISNIYLILAAITAVVAVDDSITEVSFGGLSQAALERCEKAPNCELYDTSYGISIRFIPGMEPGTESYNAIFEPPSDSNNTENALEKRDTSNTYVYMGVNSMNYGTTNPVDAFHHCGYDYCHESICDESDCLVATQDITAYTRLGSMPRDRKIRINSYGRFNGWNERNNFVEAVKAAASKGQRWTSHYWAQKSFEGWTVLDGTQWWGEQADFIDVSRYSSSGAMQGYLRVIANMDSKSPNWCSLVASSLQAIGKAINPIAGPFFGLVKACCDTNCISS